MKTDTDQSIPDRQPMAQATGPFASILRTTIRRIGAGLLDIVYPPQCAGCGRIDHDLCPYCRAHLSRSNPVLMIRDCPAPLTAAVATARHEGIVREVIQALKYDARPQLGQLLGARAAAALEQTNWQVELILPVPLHPLRLRERGYNQSQRIAETVALMSGIPLSESSLLRTRATRSQVGLSGPERRLNLQDAFVAVGDAVSQRHVLLIDDVFTTGSTLSACATALYTVGAASVYGLTVSVAHL